MNMSDYSFGAIKLTNGLKERFKTDGLDFSFKNQVRL